MGQSHGKSIDETSLNIFFDKQMETELVAKNVNFAYKRALEIINCRNKFSWEFLAAATTTGILLIAGSYYKRKDFIIPIVPIIMTTGYHYDVAFNSNRQTIYDEADKLLKTANNLEIVGGAISLKDVDEYRKILFKN